jgi:hypothetical protein
MQARVGGWSWLPRGGGAGGDAWKDDKNDKGDSVTLHPSLAIVAVLME